MEKRQKFLLLQLTGLVTAEDNTCSLINYKKLNYLKHMILVVTRVYRHACTEMDMICLQF